MSKSLLSLTLVALTMVGMSSALIVLKNGQCPSVSGQARLDMARYLGVWYEYQRFPAVFEAGQDCTSATLSQDGGRISVTNKGTLRLNLFGMKMALREMSVTLSATVPDPSKPSELAVSFRRVDMGGNRPNYIIQDTDYTNYAVVFSCLQLPGFNIQNAWILTRVPGQVPTNLATLENNLATAGVDVSKFKVINQSQCPERS